MGKQLLDREWIFRPGNKDKYYTLNKDASVVDLPHDFSIEMQREPNARSGANNGFFPGDNVVYEKTIFAPGVWKDKKVLVEFEGVYMNAAVKLNKHIVTRHPYGYTTFHCDLTPHLMYGEYNTLEVMVNNDAMPNTRWYSGSGIYRHVWLIVKELTHIPIWGVFATTPAVSEDKSLICVRTRVENTAERDVSVTVQNRIEDDKGNVCAYCDTVIDIPAGGAAEAAQELTLAPARLWSVYDPYLYSLTTRLLRGHDVIDESRTNIGVREISFTPKTGFSLNGKQMKLKGGCVHHDCGLLGAAAYDRAEVRKVELHKTNGYNAIRCAHNPPSPAFLDACDRLGMLVIDEAFDGWREAKRPYDYSLYFEDWWKRDLESMVLRDRNHPCVIMWSTGNENWEKDGRSGGYRYARELADFVRALDSTRAVTNAVNFISEDPGDKFGPHGTYRQASDDRWAELTERFIGPLDVAGYNYLHERYESDGRLYPERLICGTETYASLAFESWNETERLTHVIGDFVWTSLGYLGEAGAGRVEYGGAAPFLGEYPWHQAFCCDIDICGVKRPQSYYRDCLWGISTAPYIAVYKPEHYRKTPVHTLWAWPDVISSWTWGGFEGKPVRIDVYSENQEVELLLNGKSLGRRPAGKTQRYTAEFETVYEPGELCAIGYEDGKAVSRTSLKTSGEPGSIRLTPDLRKLKASSGELSYVLAEVLDRDGNVVPCADNNISFAVHGPGKLLAVGNRNPVSEESYVGNERRAHEGWAMAVIRADGEPGELMLTACAEGLKPAQIVIQVQ